MSLNDALRELREVATQLNAGTGRLNAAIEDFEEELEGISVGVTVWLSEPLGEHGLVLGYKRFGDGWRVAVCPATMGTLDIAVAQPLATAPRGVRVLAVERFEELTRALTTKARTYLQAINTSTEELRGGQQHNTTRKRDT